MVQNGTEFENSGLSSRRSSPESSNPPSPAADALKWNGMVQNGTEFEKSGLSSRRSSPEPSNPPPPAADALKWNGMVQNGTEIENSALSSRRQQALPIIAAAPTLPQAARSSGIGQGTPYRWLQDNRFRHELTRLRQEAADLARYELRGLMLRCLDMSTNYPTLTIPASEPESRGWDRAREPQPVLPESCPLESGAKASLMREWALGGST